MKYILTGASLPKNIEGVAALEYLDKMFNEPEVFKSTDFLKLAKQLQHDVMNIDEVIESNP